MITKEQIKTLLSECNAELEVELLQAFLAVEAGGKGFNPATGKIMIQFEPHIFTKESKIPRSKENSYIWDENKVDVQSKEWEAFNEAFKLSPDDAMESTSIGMAQIMGFHWKRLGYSSVGHMWDEFKKSEVEQVRGLIKFIITDTRLYNAFKIKDFDGMAKYYNGLGYKKLALELGREPYDISLQKAYIKFKGLI